MRRRSGVVRSSIFSPVLGLSVALVALPAGAVSLTPLAQERYVEVSSYANDPFDQVFCSDTQHVSPPDFSPFDVSLTVDCTGYGALGAVGFASQNSTITATHITASGRATGQFWYGHEGLLIRQSSSRSFLSVSFHLDEPASYEVSGLLGRLFEFGDSYVFWDLRQISGALIEERDCPNQQGDPEIEVCELPDLVSGTLAAGDYTFRVSAQSPTDADVTRFGVEYDVTFHLTGAVDDSDGDGVLDPSDNCPLDPNWGQEDADGDGQGDVCDPDDDQDGVADGADNCPFVANPSQTDADGDGQGDACDGDDDGDGVADESDNCAFLPNADQADLDADGAGDVCDADDDADGVDDPADNCPDDANPDQADHDADGIGDTCDADLDGDGVANASDNCPAIANVGQDDADGDGAGDACDPDDDGDGVADAADNCPLVANASQADLDADGQGDACDGELDGDGVPNATDNCPSTPNAGQADFDGDGAGDACDADADADGVADASDACLFTSLGALVDPGTGCSIAQLVPCEGSRGTTTAWRNHGQYVSVLTTTAQRFAEAGLISETERGAIVAAGGDSACGMP
jgi:hypothetical protein